MESSKNNPPLEALIERAISSDFDVLDGEVVSDNDSTPGFVRVMARKNRQVRNDIPVAFEMYSLLSHFLPHLPVTEVQQGAAVELVPGIVRTGTTVVALIPVAAGELEAIAFWLTDAMQSPQMKQRAGLLALPYSLEAHDGTPHLLPEWCSAFYVDRSAEHCVPLLGLRSVLQDDQFGGDWVSVALERLAAFGLPTEAATRATAHRADKPPS